MADPDDAVIVAPPKLAAIVEALAAELLNPQNANKVKAIAYDVDLEKMKAAASFAGGGMGMLTETMTAAMLAVINAGEPVYDALARAAISSLLGEHGGADTAGPESGRKLLNRIAGNSTAIEPGIGGATDFLTLFLNEQMKAWALGVGIEVVTECFPRLMPLGGGVETFAKLQEIVAAALGGGRMVRRVLNPFINASTVLPAQWHVNKTYRPELLGVGDAVQQFLRGNWTREQLDEELARQGWSAERIDAHVNSRRKFFTAGDVRTFTDRKHWPLDKGIQHLRDQGYDQDAAVDAIRLEGLRRIEQLEASEATAIIAAYADRRIAAGEFGSMMRVSVKNDEERNLLTELAEVRRAVNIKHLSPGEARACVKANVLSIIDYRRALERDGYTPEASAALELLLRRELDEKRDIEELRQEQAAERAAEKQQRELEAIARRAQVEADRALRRRGPIADLERAVVRGLIPFERLAEVLGAEYDGDTVSILLALVEDDRQRYLAQQAAADEARKAAGRRSVDVGSLERAVMAGVLTTTEFSNRLKFLKFSDADGALLTAVVAAKKADQDAAIARRREAEERAGRRRIDLGRFERLVRRGARSMVEYDALLVALGFEDADRAAMRELLDIQIADDRAADAERAAARNRLEPRGLSFDQQWRAVILGTRNIDEFQRFLVEQKFTADAQEVLLANLRLAVAEADDARRRREQPAPAPGARGLALSTLQRAARLGIIEPDTYTDRLAELGYSDDDIAIELELLLQEIADVQEARAGRAPAEQVAEARGLSLAQVERGVRAGALTLEDYRAAAAGAGLSLEATDVLAAVLTQEVGSLTEAREVRTIVLRQLAQANVSLEELERGVTKGGKSVEVFIDELRQQGIGGDEAEMVAALLIDELEAAAAKGSGGAHV